MFNFVFFLSHLINYLCCVIHVVIRKDNTSNTWVGVVKFTHTNNYFLEMHAHKST